MDYDEALHISWVDTAMVMAYDFAEAYCNHQCDDQQDRLHELNTARRVLREHLINQPASMSLTDAELRAGIELQRREIDRLRELVKDSLTVAAAEREACAAFLESGVDLSGLAGDPMMQAFTGKLLIGCAQAIRARGDV